MDPEVDMAKVEATQVIQTVTVNCYFPEQHLPSRRLFSNGDLQSVFLNRMRGKFDQSRADQARQLKRDNYAGIPIEGALRSTPTMLPGNIK